MSDNTQWKVVPVEPTPEMIAGFWGEITHGDLEIAAAKDAYRAMLAAAPAPAVEGMEVVAHAFRVAGSDLSWLYADTPPSAVYAEVVPLVRHSDAARLIAELQHRNDTQASIIRHDTESFEVLTQERDALRARCESMSPFPTEALASLETANAELRARLAEMEKAQQNEAWCPDVFPITGLPFFMWIEHHETGRRVPTYGGPFDSYTIPVRDSGGDYIRERYDHDAGSWRVDEYEDVGIQIVSDQAYVSEEVPPDAQAIIDGLREQLELKDKKIDHITAAAEQADAEVERLAEKNSLLNSAFVSAVDDTDALRAELAAAQKDAARYDFVTDEHSDFRICKFDVDRNRYVCVGNRRAVRKAIDAAMQAKEGRK